MEKLADKLGLVQTFQFLRRCVFLLFSSIFCFTILREYHCTKLAMLQITACCDLTQVPRAKERVCHIF